MAVSIVGLAVLTTSIMAGVFGATMWFAISRAIADPSAGPILLACASPIIGGVAALLAGWATALGMALLGAPQALPIHVFGVSVASSVVSLVEIANHEVAGPRAQIWCHIRGLHGLCSGYRFDIVDGWKTEFLCTCTHHQRWHGMMAEEEPRRFLAALDRSEPELLRPPQE